MPDFREAETLIRELQSRRPGINYGRDGGVGVVRCENCGCCTWSLHTDGDDEVWGCDRCHMAPLSDAEAKALRAAKAEQVARLAAEKAAAEAAAPKPREALKAVAAELAGARAEEARLEAAGAAAHDQLIAARTALDAAETALPLARSRAAEANVEALLLGKTKPQRGVASETAALEAARNGLELATTAADTLEDMLEDARRAVRKLSEQHRTAALNVLADETAPLFISRATEARSEFIMASKGLAWLEHAGVAPTSLIAAELRWSWSNVPHSWTAGDQRGPDLDAALAALLADPRAPVGERA